MVILCVQIPLINHNTNLYINEYTYVSPEDILLVI